MGLIHFMRDMDYLASKAKPSKSTVNGFGKLLYYTFIFPFVAIWILFKYTILFFVLCYKWIFKFTLFLSKWSIFGFKKAVKVIHKQN